jgi:hypothetical protein
MSRISVRRGSRVTTRPSGHSLSVQDLSKARGAEDFEPLGSHTVKGRVQPLELFTLAEAGAQRAA